MHEVCACVQCALTAVRFNAVATTSISYLNMELASNSTLETLILRNSITFPIATRRTFTSSWRFRSIKNIPTVHTWRWDPIV